MTVKRDASSLARLAPDFLELRAPSTSITTGPVPTFSEAIFVPSLDFTVATITSLLSLLLTCGGFARVRQKDHQPNLHGLLTRTSQSWCFEKPEGSERKGK